MFLDESTYGGYLLRSDLLSIGSFATYFKDSPFGAVWLLFQNPIAELVATEFDEVKTVLESVEQANSRGMYAAGFVSYDASPAFDPAMQCKRDSDFHLAQFFIYEQPPTWFKQFIAPECDQEINWKPDVDLSEFVSKFNLIHARIGDGDTYQVNYSFRLCADATPESVLRVGSSSPSPYTSLIRTSDHLVVSTSPELFFELDGLKINCKPMKGTRPRGATLHEDQLLIQELRSSPKELAENLMVVDMIRNDLGRIALLGSVQTPCLFDVESYSTVHQMTSTVTAEVDPSLSKLFRALFPCASIVGAPKIETMRIIEGCESTPRGLYTGALGFFTPGNQARFSVAIRTVILDLQSKRAVYGVGSGIVWDSNSTSEYDECLLKGQALTQPQTSWCLLETMLWDPQEGFAYEVEHVQRLKASCLQLGVPFRLEAVVAYLDNLARTFKKELTRVRLLVSATGNISHTVAAYKPSPSSLSARLASTPVQSADPSLLVKTTNRSIYEHHKARDPDVDEVLLWNERGEVTEFCLGNVAILDGNQLVTPPLSSGLLPGVLRGVMLKSGQAIERIIRIEDIEPSTSIFRLNSVSGKVPVQLSFETHD